MALRMLASKVYPKPIKMFDVLNQNARLSQWIAAHGDSPRLARPKALFEYVAAHIGAAPMDYLEFGVSRDVSINWWATHYSHAESRFYGFNSFDDLPDDWEPGHGGLKGSTFDTKAPAQPSTDRRVRYIKGWFQETLPTFLKTYVPRSRVVVHCDSHLYSSTLYALTSLNSVLAPGSILMFDAFSNHEEFRAFNDYVNAYARLYRTIGSVQTAFENVAVELL